MTLGRPQLKDSMQTTQVDGRQYDPDVEQRTEGQASFKRQLESSFLTCWGAIHEHGFQTGWKKITGKPQHGHLNPNWKDCLDFVEACFKEGLHTIRACPTLPIMKDLPDKSGHFTETGWWAHMWAVCQLHKECTKRHRAAKKSGLIRMMYGIMPTPSIQFIEALLNGMDDE